jgi:hypothetical protein
MMESGWPAVAGSGEDRDANAVYALGSSAGESARLQRQADELAPASAALLDRVGLRPGRAAIDLRCGPRGTGSVRVASVVPECAWSARRRFQILSYEVQQSPAAVACVT